MKRLESSLVIPSFSPGTLPFQRPPNLSHRMDLIQRTSCPYCRSTPWLSVSSNGTIRLWIITRFISFFLFSSEFYESGGFPFSIFSFPLTMNKGGGRAVSPHFFPPQPFSSTPDTFCQVPLMIRCLPPSSSKYTVAFKFLNALFSPRLLLALFFFFSRNDSKFSRFSEL